MLFWCFDKAGRRMAKVPAKNAADALGVATKTYGRGSFVAPDDAEAAAEQWRHERRADRWERFNTYEGAKP